MYITKETIETVLFHYGYDEIANINEHDKGITLVFLTETDNDMSLVYDISGIVQDIITMAYASSPTDFYDLPLLVFGEGAIYITFQNEVFENEEKIIYGNSKEE